MNKPNGARQPRPTWQARDARAYFSEVLKRAASYGPQIVTRRGKEVAVLVSPETGRDLEARARPCLKDLLLSDGARTDELVPVRRQVKLRRRVTLGEALHRQPF